MTKYMKNMTTLLTDSKTIHIKQHQPVVFPPMDAQKRSDNIVVKLTNVNNLLNERVKFTKLKKHV
jgi:hypothetical protein